MRGAPTVALEGPLRGRDGVLWKPDGSDLYWRCACYHVGAADVIDCQWVDPDGQRWQVVVPLDGDDVAYTMCWNK